MSTALQMPEARPTAQRPSLAPRTIQEALDFSAYLAKSELIPKDYQGKPHNIFVAVQYGMELGLPPMQALQGIAVINGRPSMWGDAVLAVVMSHPAYEWHTEVLEGEGESRTGVFTIKRRGQEPHIARFSVLDAKKAGLWGKSGPWTQHAERMLKLRARGFALRDKFPDALKGIISREEAEDYPVIDARPTFVSPQAPLPAPAKFGPYRAPYAPAVGRTAAPPAAEPSAAAEPVKITQGEAREFAKAWRSSGYSVDDAKLWLKDTLGLTSSLAIPADRLDEALAWARTPKAEAPALSPELSHCYALFDQLHYGQAERTEALAEADGDWGQLLLHLQDELRSSRQPGAAAERADEAAVVSAA